MRVGDPSVDASAVIEDDASAGYTSTLSSVSPDDIDDLFDDPELTRMHFEGIDAGEIEMQAEREAFRKFILFRHRLSPGSHFRGFRQGMLTRKCFSATSRSV